jgi:hypothetical protein
MFTSVFEASNITVSGSNHSVIFFLFFSSDSADVIVITQTIGSFSAINLILLASCSIHLPASSTAIIKSYTHSSEISNVYISFSFNKDVQFKVTIFLRVLLEGVIDFICI